MIENSVGHFLLVEALLKIKKKLRYILLPSSDSGRNDRNRWPAFNATTNQQTELQLSAPQFKHQTAV
jgi:hypothetical protein